MINKAYLVTSATVFALVAIVHFIRLVNHWQIQIGTVAFPFWGSWLAVIIGTALSMWAVNLASEWSASRQ
ncbi:MAG: hypothetical protein EA343_10460 [Nodularia sp. (in: Bacteria)]|nr:MAG: hypothetical protein EA343_10460 [Nodularia sp. (in: cyanobacteria)]